MRAPSKFTALSLRNSTFVLLWTAFPSWATVGRWWGTVGVWHKKRWAVENTHLICQTQTAEAQLWLKPAMYFYTQYFPWKTDVHLIFKVRRLFPFLRTMNKSIFTLILKTKTNGYSYCMFPDVYFTGRFYSFHFTSVTVVSLMDQRGVCLFRLEERQSTAKFIFNQSKKEDKRNVCLSYQTYTDTRKYSKSVSSAHNEWGHWISPNQLAFWAHCWVMQAALAPHPTLCLRCSSTPQAAWVSVGTGFHWGKPKESHRASSPVSQWRGLYGKSQRQRQKLRVGGYLSSGGKRNVWGSAECTRCGAKDTQRRLSITRSQCIKAVIVPLIIRTIIRPLLTHLTQQRHSVWTWDLWT